MHYCCLVFTNEFPTDKVLEEKMKPYYEPDFFDKYEHDENDELNIPREDFPAFLWDWYQVGGRYCARLKMKKDENRKEYEWGYYAREPRYNRLYRSQMLENMGENARRLNESWRFSEEDILPYCYDEATDSYRVDGCEIELIADRKDLYGYNMVRCDGSAETRSWWDGEHYMDNPDYEHQVDEEFKRAKYVCVVDIHD